MFVEKPRHTVYFFMLALCIATVLTCPAVHAAEEPTTHFYFAQVTDTHFDDNDHMQRTRKIIRHLNAVPMKLACVVHTGDIFSDKIHDPQLVSKAQSLLSNLNPPLHLVPGNHDILSDRLEITAPIYRAAFGKLITTAQYHNVVFVFIYTEPLRKSFSINGYRPLKELGKHLDQAAGKPVIVFHHAPSVKNFYNNKVHRGWQADIKKLWVELLNSYNVKAVIAGHFHRDEFHWLGKVPLYIAPPVAGYWGRQASYRIYEYRDGRISYTTQYIKP